MSSLAAEGSSRFKKIRQSASLADEVYQQLFDAIAAGFIAPSERIVQEKLAEQMQVSRTPVREALLRLENDGVLVRAGNRGFQIRTFSDQEMVQIYQAREAVEGYAAGCLSRAPDPAKERRVRRAIAAAESADKPSFREYFDANRAIHRAFVDVAGNPFLLEMFDNIWNRSGAFYLFSELSRVDLANSLEGHLALCDVVFGGDEHAAAAAMCEHIREGLRLQRSTVPMPASTAVNDNTRVS